MREAAVIGARAGGVGLVCVWLCLVLRMSVCFGLGSRLTDPGGFGVLLHPVSRRGLPGPVVIGSMCFRRNLRSVHPRMLHMMRRFRRRSCGRRRKVLGGSLRLGIILLSVLLLNHGLLCGRLLRRGLWIRFRRNALMSFPPLNFLRMPRICGFLRLFVTGILIREVVLPGVFGRRHGLLALAFRIPVQRLSVTGQRFIHCVDGLGARGFLPCLGDVLRNLFGGRLRTCGSGRHA